VRSIANSSLPNQGGPQLPHTEPGWTFEHLSTESEHLTEPGRANNTSGYRTKHLPISKAQAWHYGTRVGH